MTIRKALIVAGALLASSPVHAEGYTPWATPTSIELVNGGVLIAGAFGDVNTCGVPNYVFVLQTSSVYKDVVAMTVAAIASGRQLQFYVGACTQVTYHWVGNVINRHLDGQPVLLR